MKKKRKSLSECLRREMKDWEWMKIRWKLKSVAKTRSANKLIEYCE